MTYAEFFNQFNGKFVDFDGAYGAQCFDLVNKYSTMLGNQRFTGLYASGIYNQPGNNYIQVPNSPSAVPQAGDIIVWNNSHGGGFGHTAIANGDGNTVNFVSFDQNWQPGSPAVLVRHNYKGVIGWLRPKNINAPQGGRDMIGSGENWYNRLNKLHVQLLGVEFPRKDFPYWVGKDLLSFVEAVSDNQAASVRGNVATVAIRDNWEGQIKTLQKQFADATKVANDLQARLVASENTTKGLSEKVDALNKKVAELDSPDNIVITRGWFGTLFDKLKGVVGK